MKTRARRTVETCGARRTIVALRGAEGRKGGESGVLVRTDVTLNACKCTRLLSHQTDGTGLARRRAGRGGKCSCKTIHTRRLRRLGRVLAGGADAATTGLSGIDEGAFGASLYGGVGEALELLATISDGGESIETGVALRGTYSFITHAYMCECIQ